MQLFWQRKSLKEVQNSLEFLGHRNLDSAKIYTRLIDTQSDEYYSAVAKTTEEARKLLEGGFDYVCTITEDIMLFRKQK